MTNPDRPNHGAAFLGPRAQINAALDFLSRILCADCEARSELIADPDTGTTYVDLRHADGCRYKEGR